MAVGILDPKKGIVWQGNEAQLPPDVIEQLQALEARKRMGGIDTSPVDHWTQGAARVVDALGGVLRQKRLDNAATENTTYNEGLIGSLLGNSGGTPAAAQTSMPEATGAGQEMAATSPDPAAAPVDLSGDRGTFIQSLLPAAMEESKRTGVDPRIIVAQAAQETGWGKSAPGNNLFGIKSHGQDGGNSLMTTEYVDGKPVKMRDSFRSFASPADSVRGYGDFILNNPRYEPLRKAQGLDAQLGALQASGYATDPNYSRSVGAIARGIQLPAEVAAATPQAAIEAIAPGSGYVDPVVSAPNANQAAALPSSAASFDERFNAPAAAMGPAAPDIYTQPSDVPELPAPVEVSAPPTVASVPASPQQQVAQAMTAQPQQPSQASSALNPAIIKALTDPRASPGTKAVAQILMQQEQAKAQAAQAQQTWMARQQYEQQQQANDPLRQLQIKEAQIKVGSANRQPLINAGGGALYDPNTKDWIKSPSSNSQFRQAAPEEAAKYGATGGQFGPDGRFYPINPPSGMSLSVGPDGQMNLNQGPGVKPLTEGQSKDSFFTTRMTAATPTIDKFESALLSPDQAAADYVPGGRYYQSEEYQLAKDAGRDFVNAYLRKDSGAALTTEEERNYGQLLLPQPGDKPAIIDAKRQRRSIAMEAIKSGMPSNAIDGVLKAIKAVPGADQPAQTTNQKKTSTGIPWSLED